MEGHGVTARSALWAVLGLLLGQAYGFASPGTNSNATVVLVLGAAGEDELGQDFARSAAAWQKACETAGARQVVLGLGPTNEAPDVERLRQALAAEPTNCLEELWIVLLGHGTFDGKDAKFNLRGPDLSATNLASWLQPFKRPLAVIDCTSSSAPFLKALAAPDRVLVTATRSGFEQNYARFGRFLAETIASSEADLDRDGQTSLLEAFLMASRRVSEFYNSEGRLATEHALIDDNGDGLGTPAEWFRGIRAVKRARDGAALDGLRAHQFHLVRSAAEQHSSPAVRARRDELELAVAKLRDTKSGLAEDEYYRRLETLLLELAKLSAP
jgi:hypothetical protein